MSFDNGQSDSDDDDTSSSAGEESDDDNTKVVSVGRNRQVFNNLGKKKGFRSKTPTKNCYKRLYTETMAQNKRLTVPLEKMLAKCAKRFQVRKVHEEKNADYCCGR